MFNVNKGNTKGSRRKGSKKSHKGSKKKLKK